MLISAILIPLLTWYLGESPSEQQWAVLKTCGLVAFGLSMLCFITGEITKNYSQVDKIWSLSPLAYAWITVGYYPNDPRLWLMAILISIWGLRLTYNFSRRGGYSWKIWEGEEDYRWEIVKSKPYLKIKWVWSVFNLVFISIYQNLLILLFTAPIIASIVVPNNPLTYWDAILGLLALGLIIIETVADQQQWNFQNAKSKRINNTDGKASGPNFISTGLWARSRHPNYQAEQSFWLVIYLLSIVGSQQIFNWSIIGICLLVLLFWGSSNLSEDISKSKYPEYADYQDKVPRYWPGIF